MLEMPEEFGKLADNYVRISNSQKLKWTMIQTLFGAQDLFARNKASTNTVSLQIIVRKLVFVQTLSRRIL